MPFVAALCSNIGDFSLDAGGAAGEPAAIALSLLPAGGGTTLTLALPTFRSLAVSEKSPCALTRAALRLIDAARLSTDFKKAANNTRPNVGQAVLVRVGAPGALLGGLVPVTHVLATVEPTVEHAGGALADDRAWLHDAYVSALKAFFSATAASRSEGRTVPGGAVRQGGC